MSTTVGARIPALLFYISTFALHHGPALPNLCKTVVSTVVYILSCRSSSSSFRLSKNMEELDAHSLPTCMSRSSSSRRTRVPDQEHARLPLIVRAHSARTTLLSQGSFCSSTRWSPVRPWPTTRSARRRRQRQKRPQACTRPRAKGLPTTLPCPASRVCSTNPARQRARSATGSSEGRGLIVQADLLLLVGGARPDRIPKDDDNAVNFPQQGKDTLTCDWTWSSLWMVRRSPRMASPWKSIHIERS
jgi:hypothetical protein